MAKVDYQINSKQSLFVRYFGTHSLQPSSFTGSELSVQNAGTDDLVNSVVVGHTYLLSANALNTFHFSFNTVGITKFQVPIVNPTDLGVQGMYTSAAPFTHFSNINISGDFQSAGGFATPGLVNTKTYQLADDFSLTKGSHQLQFGVSFIRPWQIFHVLRLLQWAIYLLGRGRRQRHVRFRRRGAQLIDPVEYLA